MCKEERMLTAVVRPFCRRNFFPRALGWISALSFLSLAVTGADAKAKIAQPHKTYQRGVPLRGPVANGRRVPRPTSP